MPPKFSRHWGLITLAAATIMVMSAAAWVDMDWTMGIGKMRWPWIEEIMGRSVFEGEAPGANDLVILLLLGAVIVYYLGWRSPNKKKWVSWRPQCGFVIVSALVTAVYFVHGCKWAVGRARPDLVIEKGAEFSHWFTFGPHFVTDGIFYGSFPSGHTAQMFILMAVAYVLAGDPLPSGKRRQVGILWAVVSLIAALAMGLTRCMTLSHWLTDILGSTLIGWTLMHLLYFDILRVPDQRRFLARHGAMPGVPDAWELIFCIHLFVGTLGAVITTIGIRSVLIHKGPWLATLIPAGIACLLLSGKLAWSLLRTVWIILDRKWTHDTTDIST
jgi:membrane-associated phospholipid phosphatase